MAMRRAPREWIPASAGMTIGETGEPPNGRFAGTAFCNDRLNDFFSPER